MAKSKKSRNFFDKATLEFLEKLEKIKKWKPNKKDVEKGIRYRCLNLYCDVGTFQIPEREDPECPGCGSKNVKQVGVGLKVVQGGEQ